jgi:hypothetical protein
MECPTCGADNTPANGVMDALPERHVARVVPMGTAGAIVGSPGGAGVLRVMANARLASRVWRQPAVRAGAGALALSVGLRLTRIWLARANVRRDLRRATPSLAESLAGRLLVPLRPRPVARGGEVVETWIYVRQERVGR